jgi:hypothetical protein
LPEISTCEQTSPHNFDPNQNRTVINFLQIQDVEVVPFHENIVIATDYNQGILFYEITCIDDLSCQYLPIAFLSEPSVSEITILQDEGLAQEQILFVQRVNPPWIYEIKYSIREKPSVRRVYTLQDDEGEYVGMSLLDAN